MKVRTDFITNSSSSSYVVVIETKHLNTFLKNASPLIHKIFEKRSVTESFLGKKVTILSYISGEMSNLERSWAGDPAIGRRIEEEYVDIESELNMFLEQIDLKKKIESHTWL